MLIDGGTLSRSLKTLLRLVDKRSTLPILDHVLFEPVDGGIALVATDLTSQVRVTIAADAPFSTCLPARSLFEFVAAAGRGAQISIEIVGAVAHVTSAGSLLELPHRPPREFPGPIQHDETSLQIVEGAKFLDAIGWVARAIGSDPTRPQLGGVFLDGDRIIATDGHRLHLASLDGLACPRVLIPSSAVAFSLMALRGGETIKISVAETSVQLRSCTWTITARLVDEVFPSYPQVIPKTEDAAFLMRVGTDVLEAGLRRVARRGNRGKVAPLRLRANGAIKFEAAVDDVQLTAHIDVIDSTHEGDDHLMGFNGRYLIEAIAGIDAVASLRFYRPDDPVLIELDDRIAVVMPFRI